jgi:hypothetical protein
MHQLIKKGNQAYLVSPSLKYGNGVLEDLTLTIQSIFTVSASGGNRKSRHRTEGKAQQ